MKSSDAIVKKFRAIGKAVPAFNIPYLPMVEPVIKAVKEQNTVAFITVARLEWIKFEAKSLRAVYEEFCKFADPQHVRLHLDHVPVIDEDKQKVDYLAVIKEAIELGYSSIMVDASRLPLAENIKCTKEAVALAQAAGIACEAELGAIAGHGAEKLPPYEELFASGEGFTDPEEAKTFVHDTECDWLSVAVGTVHGAISRASKDKKKVAARISLEQLARLDAATGIPLVLHGGSSVIHEYLLQAIKNGIAKINIATEIRQPYEQTLKSTGKVCEAQQAVYERTCRLLQDYIQVSGLQSKIMED